MPDVGQTFTRQVIHDGRYYQRGEVVWLRDALPPNKGHRLEADPRGDHEVVEYQQLGNFPQVARCVLKRLR